MRLAGLTVSQAEKHRSETLKLTVHCKIISHVFQIVQIAKMREQHFIRQSDIGWLGADTAGSADRTSAVTRWRVSATAGAFAFNSLPDFKLSTKRRGFCRCTLEPPGMQTIVRSPDASLPFQKNLARGSFTLCSIGCSVWAHSALAGCFHRIGFLGLRF